MKGVGKRNKAIRQLNRELGWEKSIPGRAWRWFGSRFNEIVFLVGVLAALYIYSRGGS